ncbi:50S ribosomal protein L25, partial [candidate division GN15 bacterium]|nr:50S ribosomal protein L25 [candidate division GN15 bacterium]
DASTILSLTVDGKENKVLVREIQRHPVTSKVLHVDFHAISMNKPINVRIPINLIGTPEGVKTDGGIMQTTLRDLDISCLPKDIPDDFEVDVSQLRIGDSIHVSDIEIPNAEILTLERRTIVTIAAPTVIKAAATAEEEEELAEGEEGEAAAEGEEGAEEGAETAEGEEKKEE